MDKYLIPICDASDNARCWIEIILARTVIECQEKLMNRLMDRYDFLEEGNNYKDFVDKADTYNIIIGKITDIEEL